MAYNYSISKDELYGPPPAYSITNNYENSSPPPPSYTPSVYVVPIRESTYDDRSLSHAMIILSKQLTRYLLGTGLVHMVIGLAAIVCDIILTVINESYSFTGLWAGSLCIILGIYLIIFMSHSKKRRCSLKRLQYIHMLMCLIIIIALILSSINLASDSCYKIFLGPDRCQHSGYLIKIFLITLFSLTFIQLCTTIAMILIHRKKSRLVVTRNNHRTSQIIG